MLNPDKNNYIKAIYKKSIFLHKLREQLEEFDENYFVGENDQQLEEEGMEEMDELQIDGQDKTSYMCNREAEAHNQAVYKQLKRYLASDVYLFTNPNETSASKYLSAEMNYIQYPRKKELLEIINKTMLYQDSQGLVDFHPSYNDLSQDMKNKVDSQMQIRYTYGFWYSDQKEKGEKSSHKAPLIRNILHQSLQPFHQSYSTISSPNIIETIWGRNSLRKIDVWGKIYASSPSQFLWLPAQFIYSSEEKRYHVQGKLFHSLEESEHMSKLKTEVAELMTFFAPALKTTHDYYSKLVYQVVDHYGNQKIIDLPGQKEDTSFDEKIHAIVKITEMTIEPHSTYTGQWHVEGYSSDNIIYTCLYVIEQDEQLTGARLKFKRGTRLDDAPLAKGEYQPQCAHSFCPNYETLCDPHQLIPLGSLDIKENLMIVFPNQNIHKVKGFKNNTDGPLKRKIIAFFVVDHETQPLTINDVSYTQPLSFIKEKRLLDMYERSKNKQTETQSFNYCEH